MNGLTSLFGMINHGKIHGLDVLYYFYPGRGIDDNLAGYVYIRNR